MAMWANGCGTIMANTLRQRKPIWLARTAVRCGYTGAAAGMILLNICTAHIVPHLRRIRAALILVCAWCLMRWLAPVVLQAQRDQNEQARPSFRSVLMAEEGSGRVSRRLRNWLLMQLWEKHYQSIIQEGLL